MRNTVWTLGLAAGMAWCLGEAPGLRGQVPPAPRAGDVVPIFKFHKRKPDPQPPPETVKLQVDAFFASLKGGAAAVRPAYETLLRGSRIAERAENIDVLVAKTIHVMGSALENCRATRVAHVMGSALEHCLPDGAGQRDGTARKPRLDRVKWSAFEY